MRGVATGDIDMPEFALRERADRLESFRIEFRPQHAKVMAMLDCRRSLGGLEQWVSFRLVDAGEQLPGSGPPVR